MSKITKIYSLYTNEVLELKAIFENSIRDDWEIILKYYNSTMKEQSNFGTPGWYNVIKEKVLFLAEKIEENMGDIILWSDLDIKFYSKCSDIIYSALIDNDIVFQAENWPNKEVNTGFIAIRCNKETLALYKQLVAYDFYNLPFADQSAMNKILRDDNTNVKWDVLPRQFWATSHYMFDSLMPPQDIVLHHANCTPPTVIDGKIIESTQLKLEQLNIINDYISSLPR